MATWPPGRTSALACLLGGALVVACSRAPEIEEREVFVYSPRSCPVSESEAYSVIYAAGDFEPSIDAPPTASVFLREIGRALTELPKETRSLVVDVSQRELDWRGVAELPRRGPINVLVWRGVEACRLTRDVERRADMTFAVIGRHFVVAGGRSFDGSHVPRTFVGDLTTGAIERLSIGLGTRRLRPSVTAFPPSPDEPSAALVAGGADPDHPDRALATAEVYVPHVGAPSDVGDFDGRIDLSEPRAEHGAVVLASGETLLVGGRGPAGPLRTMEIVDPATRRARTGGVALLAVARTSPTVLRLASGEIMVAGGTDAKGAAVPTVEWFSPDASAPTKRPVDLVTGRERAFVPLEAGGALAVVAPEGTAPDFKTVWVISADGAVEPGLPVDPSTLESVRLFPGAEGAPVLWTGTKWLRWSPWFGAFQPIPAGPSTGPSLDAIATGDSGLALWLEDRGVAGMNVLGFRFATRTRFGAVPKPLLTTSAEHLAPDRLAGRSIRFDEERGLLLDPGASAFVTDVTFADFELDLEVTAAAAVVVLRGEGGDEVEIGGADCAPSRPATRTVAVKRRGARVSFAVDDDAARGCPIEVTGRVALGLRGAQGAGVSGARNLRVTRR